MTGPAGNSESYFPSTSTLRVWGKQNSLFPLGPVMKCLLLARVLVALMHLEMLRARVRVFIQRGEFELNAQVLMG